MVAFMICVTAMLSLLVNCCYCCLIAAWIQSVKSYRRPDNNQEQVLDPNLDPADRAAIEAAMRDLNNVQEVDQHADPEDLKNSQTV